MAFINKRNAISLFNGTIVIKIYKISFYFVFPHKKDLTACTSPTPSTRWLRAHKFIKRSVYIPDAWECNEGPNFHYILKLTVTAQQLFSMPRLIMIPMRKDEVREMTQSMMSQWMLQWNFTLLNYFRIVFFKQHKRTVFIA